MRIALSLVLSMAALGCDPFVMLPGGELEGSVRPPPAEWSFTDDVETVQLETRPGDPYSVNVWGVAVGDRFYVASGRGGSAAWAENIAADPRVRLRVGSDVYELEAVRVEDETELDAFLEAAVRKYDFEPEPEQRDEAVLFRLQPRGANQS